MIHHKRSAWFAAALAAALALTGCHNDSAEPETGYTYRPADPGTGYTVPADDSEDTWSDDTASEDSWSDDTWSEDSDVTVDEPDHTSTNPCAFPGDYACPRTPLVVPGPLLPTW